jgi:[ribosomal protein S5]-alanine N-acetyltransferase
MKYITPQLETERLILKRGAFEDYKKVYEYDFTKLRDIAGEFEFVKQEVSEIVGYDSYADRNEDVFDWIIYLRDGTPIGNIVADRVDKEINSIEIAFNLHPVYWKKGYMREAIIKTMDYLYNIGFDNILCGYSEGNVKSQKLVEKLGFEFWFMVEGAWTKNGQAINDYKYIMSKDMYNNLYKNNVK